MVTWGPSTTNLFGTSTPASSATIPVSTNNNNDPAPAPTAFSFGSTTTPSTPPLTSQAPSTNPPPLNTAFSFGGGSSGGSGSGGLFGASSSAPAPSGGLFGSNAAPAPAPTGGLFGSTPAPSGGLFGSTTTTPAPSGGLFGASAPAPSGGLFGASAPAPSGGLFGSSAPAPSGGLFGAPAPAPSGGLFGAPAPAPSTQQQSFQMTPNPHQAAYHVHQSISAHQEAARIEEAIANLHSKYSSTSRGAPTVPSSLCAFKAILYDALTGEQRSAIAALSTSNIGGSTTTNFLAQSMATMSISPNVIPKPAHISQKAWNEAHARNPNPGELAPVALVGAASLHSRLVSQQEKSNELANHADKLKESLEYLQKAAATSQEDIRRACLVEELNRSRILEVMCKVEILRCMGQPIQNAERDGMERLDQLLREVNSMTRKLVDVEEKAKEQSRILKRRAASGSYGNVDWSMGKEEKAVLMEVLDEQSCGLEGLGRIVKREERDAKILKDELERTLSGGWIGGGRTKVSKPLVGEGGVAIFPGF